MPIGPEVSERVEIPEKVNVNFDDKGQFKVNGSNGQLVRTLYSHRVQVRRDGKAVVFSCEYPGKQDKAMVGTFAAHLRNMCKGVVDGYQYTMKVVYAHFPIKVTLKGKEIVIENFLGEKCARHADVVGDTKVLIKGNDITVIGANVEHVGQTAANIERASRIKDRDPRVFQDGIYLVERKG